MVTKTEIEIQVTHLRIRLVKVSFPGGHHLVVGGRLVSSAKDGVVTPHPDLPVYTPAMFPVPLDPWIDGENSDAQVSVSDGGPLRSVGAVRACTLLFTEREKRAVEDWIRSQKR